MMEKPTILSRPTLVMQFRHWRDQAYNLADCCLRLAEGFSTGAAREEIKKGNPKEMGT
jgi:hypothetical protein